MRVRIIIMFALVALLTACGTTETPANTSNTGAQPAATTKPMADKPTEKAMTDKPTEKAMMDKPTEQAMADKPTEKAMMDKPTEQAMADKPTEKAMTDHMADMAAWQTMELTNVVTGKTFKLADFVGKPVYVETMATWCPNCKQQLTTAQESHKMSMDGANAPVFVAISVETDLNAQTLADYAKNNGFDFYFAVASPELLKELVATFGNTVANPPTTPHFIIAADGKYGELMTGKSSADEIAAALEKSMK